MEGLKNMYSFYIKMQGRILGPYSPEQILEWDLPGDILVREESIEEWNPARYYNFPELVGEENTAASGIGQKPACLKRWSWGGFILGWIWGFFNGVYWPLLTIPANFIPYAGLPVMLVVHILLGLKGNSYAWKARAWKSPTTFDRIQRYWAKVGLVIATVVLLSSLFLSLYIK